MAIDSQWRYTYVNATAEKLLSRSRNDLLGRSIWEVFPAEKESNSRAYQEFHRVVSEQVSVKFEEFSPSLQMYIEVSAYPAAKDLRLIGAILAIANALKKNCGKRMRF